MLQFRTPARTFPRQVLTMLLAAGFAASATVASAHHPFPATYVEGETTKVEGELAAFMFRNPHSYVHLNVTDDSGNVIRYAIEWGAAATLGRQGIPNRVDSWGPEWHHDWVTWRRMLPQILGEWTESRA